MLFIQTIKIMSTKFQMGALFFDNFSHFNYAIDFVENNFLFKPRVSTFYQVA